MLNELLFVWGLPILLLLIFLGQLGLPLGTLVFLCWYGSTITDIESLFWVIPLLLVPAILGDYTAYCLAQKYRLGISNYVDVRSKALKPLLKGSFLIQRNASLIVFLTRFLVFGLGPLVNYLMGLKSFPRSKFILWVCVGEFIYITEFILLGYLFRDTWQALLIIIADIGWILGSISVMVLIMFKLRKRRLARKTTK